MSEARPFIRTLTLAETGELVDWAAGEGWNPGRDDAPAFHAADPGGFIGAFVDGAMVAGISAVAYGDDFGFIGLYICRPDCRNPASSESMPRATIGSPPVTTTCRPGNDSTSLTMDSMPISRPSGSHEA